MQNIEHQHHLDTKGLTCPEPVMLLHGAIRDAKKGEVIKVEATDPSTLRDIPKFCQFLGHTLLGQCEADATDSCETKTYVYFICRQ